MCHELRTPMNIVVGMAWLLQHSGLSPVQQNYLREIQGASDQLLRIISQLLGDARAGPGTESLWPCAASELAAGVRGYPRASLPEFAWQPPEPAQCDEIQWPDLRQQLVTLLRASDTDCIQLAFEHQSLLRARFAARYECWSRALADFDFESALPLIEALSVNPSAG